MRRALAAAGLVVLIAAAAVLAFDSLRGSSRAGSIDNAAPTALARVSRRSLSSQTQVSATLGYADSATIVAPPGTSPADVLQAQQSAASGRSALQSAQAALSADESTLEQVGASLAAARRKQASDCGGDNAASPSGACAGDAQSVAADEQSLAGDRQKVVGDRAAVSSDERSLASAETALATAESSALPYGQASTYTMLPSVGAVIRRGQALYAIGGVPTVLLYGRRTAWRAFRAGMSPGADVAELNANLGLAGDGFTAATASAIRSFQARHGLAQTGELSLGSVVFEPGPVRVTSVTPSLGAAVQAGAVLSVTSTARRVTIALDAAQQAQVKVGDKVTITLPDNSTTPGVVASVGTVATTPASNNGSSSSPTIEVDVTPTDPAATGRLDQAPVEVSITTATVDDALAVPVNALLALAGGGYAVEAVSSDGTHRLQPVTLGLFDDADGLVQVSGSGLRAGQEIVVPATS